MRFRGPHPAAGSPAGTGPSRRFGILPSLCTRSCLRFKNRRCPFWGLLYVALATQGRLTSFGHWPSFPFAPTFLTRQAVRDAREPGWVSAGPGGPRGVRPAPGRRGSYSDCPFRGLPSLPHSGPRPAEPPPASCPPGQGGSVGGGGGKGLGALPGLGSGGVTWLGCLS